MIGAFLCGKLYKARTRRLRERLSRVDQSKLLEPASAKIFWFLKDVELTARFSTDHLFGRRRPIQKHLVEIESIFLKGLIDFQKSSRIRVSYMLYTLHILQDQKTAFQIAHELADSGIHMSIIDKLSLKQILRLEVEETEIALLGTTVITMQPYMRSEMARLLKSTKISVLQCLQNERNFWSLLSTLDGNWEKDYETNRSLEVISISTNREAALAESGIRILMAK